MSLDLDIKREKHGDKVILRLYGRIDGATSPRLGSELTLAIDGGNAPILIDFSEVDYLSSAGLRVILAATKKHKELHPDQPNGRLALFSLKEHIRGIVHDAGFDRAFRLCEGEKEALQIQ